MDQSRARLLLAALILLLGTHSFGMSCSSPAINILTPTHGSFSTATNVTVSGNVTNINVVNALVTVNGTVVPVQPNGSWSIEIPQNPATVVNPYLAQLTNLATGKTFKKRVAVVVGDSVLDGAFSEEGVALRLNDSGLDTVEPLLETLAGAGLDLSVLLPVGTYITSISALWNFDIYIDSPAPTFQNFSIDVNSQTGVVDGFIDINNLHADLFIDGTGFLAPDCTGDVDTSLLEINGQYALSPLGSDPSNVDVVQVGPVSFGNTNFNVSLNGLICDIAEFFGIIGDDFNSEIQSGLSGFLNAVDGNGNTPIAAAIETALAGISIAGPIGEGLGLNLETPLFAVLEDTAGITLGSDARITPACTPPAGAPDFAESYHIDEPFPVFGALTPVAGLPYGLGMCISTSAFNQLMKSEVECGLLQATLNEIDLGTGPVPITAQTLSIIVPQFSGFPPTLPMEIVIRPTLAPIVTGNPGPAGELAELLIGHLELEINGISPAVTYLAGAADIRLGLDLSFDNLTGALAFELAAPNPADITVAILKNQVNTNEAIVEQVLPYILGPFLPSLADSFASIPLPNFLGLELQGVEVSRNGQFMSLFADLVPTP